MKTFTLYKRGTDGKNLDTTAPGYAERPWYFKFEFRGTSYPRCTETNLAKTAQKEARRLYEEITGRIKNGESIEHTKTRHAVRADLADLHALYMGAPGPDNPTPDPRVTVRLKASLATRTMNVRAQLRLLGRVFNREHAALLATPFDELLTGRTKKQWFALHANTERSAKVTANSDFRKAASLCGARELELYKEVGITHDCLAEFATGTGQRFDKSDLGELHYSPPDEKIVAATLRDWEACEDRNVFLAIGHALAFGLRIGEIAQARWSWWQTRFGSPMLVATADAASGGKFKHNRIGHFDVPALDPWYSAMKRKAIARDWLPTGHSDAYILTGSDFIRKDATFRAVSDFLRARGWVTRTTNHALRAYAGCQVAIAYSLFDAQRFLRHSSIKVTQDHYLYLLNNGPHMEYLRARCPARWATLATEAAQHAEKITASPWLEQAAVAH